MKANFTKSLKLVGESEGGYVDHPKDPGGATMRGVTLAVYKAYRRAKGRSVPSKEDLRAITDAEVRDIFKEQYWDAVRGDDLPLGIDFAAFDFAINSGSGQASKDLQRCIGVDADGKIGMLTMAAVDKAYKESREKLINNYLDRRLAFFKKLRTWGTFGRGWAARVKHVRTNALAMARRKVQVEAAPVEESEAVKANPADVAVERTSTGKSVIITLAGAAGTAVAGSADRVLEATTGSDIASGNLVLIGVVAFVLLTIAGGIATAYYLKHKATDEGTI